jgi:hypothetical protein
LPFSITTFSLEVKVWKYFIRSLVDIPYITEPT